MTTNKHKVGVHFYATHNAKNKKKHKTLPEGAPVPKKHKKTKRFFVK
jgi:hypothetical protein